MRAVVQRVKDARVVVDGEIAGAIDSGLLVYVGVEKGDGDKDIEYIATKIVNLRVFEDIDGRMNLSLLDIDRRGTGLLAISQFTLHGDVRKGRRPSFDRAEKPVRARELFTRLVESIEEKGVRVEKGVFQAHMEVTSTNDGPVTILLDSGKTF